MPNTRNSPATDRPRDSAIGTPPSTSNGGVNGQGIALLGDGEGEGAAGLVRVDRGGVPDHRIGAGRQLRQVDDQPSVVIGRDVRLPGGERLRRALAASMAAGGQGARDGGKTRGSLMRRAASAR